MCKMGDTELRFNKLIYIYIYIYTYIYIYIYIYIYTYTNTKREREVVLDEIQSIIVNDILHVTGLRFMQSKLWIGQ